MWAQLISMRLKPGKEGDLPRVYEQLRAAEQPGSGLLRTTTAIARPEGPEPHPPPSCSSRARRRRGPASRTPRARPALEGVRATMAEIFEGPPEFVDLEVLEDTVY